MVSARRALSAASQSKCECTDRALNGDRAVLAVAGESLLESAGETGILRLGKMFGPVTGADRGSAANGLGGIAGAVAGGGGISRWSCSHLHEQSVCSLVAVEGTDSGVLSPDSDRLLPTAGELSDMARRKST